MDCEIVRKHYHMTQKIEVAGSGVIQKNEPSRSGGGAVPRVEASARGISFMFFWRDCSEITTAATRTMPFSLLPGSGFDGGPGVGHQLGKQSGQRVLQDALDPELGRAEDGAGEGDGGDEEVAGFDFALFHPFADDPADHLEGFGEADRGGIFHKFGMLHEQEILHHGRVFFGQFVDQLGKGAQFIVGGGPTMQAMEEHLVKITQGLLVQNLGQVFFAAEEIVDGPGADSRMADDIGYRNPVVAPFDKKLAGAVENAPGFVLGVDGAFLFFADHNMGRIMKDKE